MTKSLRKIVFIDFLNQAEPQMEYQEFKGLKFEVIRHSIGWNFETAEKIIKACDGEVDGICISGLVDTFDFEDIHITHKPSRRLMNLAQETPVYSGHKLRSTFAEWTMIKYLKINPHILSGKRLLFHCAMVSPAVDKLCMGGSIPFAADLNTILGLPVLVKSTRQMRLMLKTLKPIIESDQANLFYRHRSRGVDFDSRKVRKLRQWISKMDTFVTFRSLIDRVGAFDVFAGKTLIVDSLSTEQRERLKRAEVGRIIELIPQQLEIDQGNTHSFTFTLLYAFLDQYRLETAPEQNFDEFLLQYIEENNVKPNEINTVAPMHQRCAFVIHPLEFNDMLRSGATKWIGKLPEKFRFNAEKLASKFPVFKYGEIRGVKSASNGQTLTCDIYAVIATPKLMKALDEEFVYKKLICAAKSARLDGCVMIGLGAYTKVIGDAGITVAKRSPIPVTNGNSYSAAATLWAARVVIEKMGILKMHTEGKLAGRVNGKAMVIGATGSIGKVSSHLLAKYFPELILVGRRAEKLLELREEIEEQNPGIIVRIKTDPNVELMSTDLIITSTSNDTGKVLDMMQVKPGAVICDCSRPLDIDGEDAKKRPDVLVIESGEIDLPGVLEFGCDVGLPYPSVYACLAETVLLTLEGRPQSFSLGKDLSLQKVQEIYRLGIKHGAKLAAIRGPNGFVTEADIVLCRDLAMEHRKTWTVGKAPNLQILAEQFKRRSKGGRV